MSFLSKSNLLNKIKTRLKGIKPSFVVADDNAPQTVREITPDQDNNTVVARDNVGRTTTVMGTWGEHILHVVNEPQYQRSTTASRRMHQLLLDGNRTQRRFNASPTGRKQRAQDLLRSLAGVN